MLAVSTAQWIGIAIIGAIAAAGFGLAAINVLSIVRPRKAGEAGPPRPLVGPPKQVTRRAFFRRALGTGFGLSMGGFGAASLAFLWPNLAGGFGGKITMSTPIDSIKSTIQTTKQPYYYAPGRFYIVPYEASSPAKAKIYTDAGLVAEGLMALYQRCVHLGCRVPFCATSQWFECPCHGSKYNRVGEWKAGPAPRGLDRFPLTVDNGIITVDTGLVVTGPPRGTNTTGQEAEGAFCVGAGGEH
ncbi:MAG TPA: Rieske 2Fe-2S domain-containing protein [Actinomycetota bacterium]|nr:Rieske 2Fe-2S domain-containing protein [Actinomycetota bacterium]